MKKKILIKHKDHYLDCCKIEKNHRPFIVYLSSGVVGYSKYCNKCKRIQYYTTKYPASEDRNSQEYLNLMNEVINTFYKETKYILFNIEAYQLDLSQWKVQFPDMIQIELKDEEDN